MRTIIVRSALLAIAILVYRPVVAQQVTVTVDPNNYAPGRNISTAMPGARLRSVTFAPNPNPNAPPEQAYVPVYSPVYVQTMAPGCLFVGLPCTPSGNSLLSYVSSPTPSSVPIQWGQVNDAMPCFIGQCNSGPPQLTVFPVLRVDFDKPTDSASVVFQNYQYQPTQGLLFAFSAAAFDDTGNVVGQCVAFVPSFNVNCTDAYVAGPYDAQGDGWIKVTFTDPNGRIRFIAAGGSSQSPALASVQFHSPVAIQLAGLLTRSKGVGPGASLELKALFAVAYYAARDTSATCAMLRAYANEVTAQSGRHIPALQGAQLLSIVQPVEAAIGCRS
jgi:hypothetical protein